MTGSGWEKQVGVMMIGNGRAEISGCKRRAGGRALGDGRERGGGVLVVVGWESSRWGTCKKERKGLEGAMVKHL